MRQELVRRARREERRLTVNLSVGFFKALGQCRDWVYILTANEPRDPGPGP